MTAPVSAGQGTSIQKLKCQTPMPGLSYCQTKYDNQNRLTEHLLKLSGSDL